MTFYPPPGFSRVRQPYHSDKPSRTQTSFAQDADINNIMARIERTGMVPLSSIPPRFGDYPDLSLAEALNLVAEANAEFAALPSRLREAFHNSPAVLAQFLTEHSDEDFTLLAQSVGVEPPPASSSAEPDVFEDPPLPPPPATRKPVKG